MQKINWLSRCTVGQSENGTANAGIVFHCLRDNNVILVLSLPKDCESEVRDNVILLH